MTTKSSHTPYFVYGSFYPVVSKSTWSALLKSGWVRSHVDYRPTSDNSKTTVYNEVFFFHSYWMKLYIKIGLGHVSQLISVFILWFTREMLKGVNRWPKNDRPEINAHISNHAWHVNRDPYKLLLSASLVIHAIVQWHQNFRGEITRSCNFVSGREILDWSIIRLTIPTIWCLFNDKLKKFVPNVLNWFTSLEEFYIKHPLSPWCYILIGPFSNPVKYSYITVLSSRNHFKWILSL